MALSKLFAASWSTSLTLALALATAPEADAGWLHRRARCCGCPCVSRAARHAAPGPRVVASPAPAYPTPQAAHPAAGGGPGESTGSPGDFVAWLNAIRARHGLGRVGWDPGLASDAAANSSRGFGHGYLGRARRQNAGVGSLGAVQGAWLASPAHASALLDPSVTRVGLANVGGVWTFNGG